MSEADRWRICPHPSLVPHPLPERLPTAPSGRSHLIHWRDTATDIMPHSRPWPKLSRCVLCGQVGELATPNV